jgi:hypothetical protein
LDDTIRVEERTNLPLEDMEAAGWQMTRDPSMSNRRIVSMTTACANKLFASRGMPATVLLGVHYQNFPKKDRKEGEPTHESSIYGVYLTPNHKGLFYVWTSYKINEWLVENKPSSLPVCVEVNPIVKVDKKEREMMIRMKDKGKKYVAPPKKPSFYDVKFTTLTPEAKELLWTKFVTPEDRETIEENSRDWPPPFPKQKF